MSEPSAEVPYDLNFCFPVPPVLESSRVRLVPFVPATHVEAFHASCASYPSIFDWLPFHGWSTLSETEQWVEDLIRKDSGRVLFVIYDLAGVGSPETSSKTSAKSPAFAGVLAYINTSPLNLCTEIGAVLIFPPWQRTHVAKNAVGLLMKYGLDLPTPAPVGEEATKANGSAKTQAPSAGGIGLRRVVWQANARNVPSVKLAKRMGFHLEGILRWDRALPPGKERASNHLKEGLENTDTLAPSRKGDPKPGWVGRDTAMLSVCWDDWENGVKELVLDLMEK